MCLSCQQSYDVKERAPRCFIPCGHTICFKCLAALNADKKCVICKKDFTQTIPDHEMIDMIKRPKPKLLQRTGIKDKMIKFMKTDEAFK